MEGLLGDEKEDDAERYYLYICGDDDGDNECYVMLVIMLMLMMMMMMMMRMMMMIGIILTLQGSTLVLAPLPWASRICKL